MSLPYPNVPNLPGVPQIPRAPGQAIPFVMSIAAASSGIAAFIGASTPQQTEWGVFNSDGAQVIKPDSVVDFGNSNSWDVSNFPVQKGAFATYNKVVVPFEATVRMTKGGEVTDRTNFLQQIAAIAGDTNLYTILTPEQSYLNCNITRYEFTRRGAAGSYFIDVDLYFIQIVQVTAQYTSTTLNATDPTAQPATNQGAVQLGPVTPQVQSSVYEFPSFN